MAELRPFEQIDAGGVDSRSNPINMPRNRALRCLNWCPKQAGYWELRWGYSTVSMSTVSASAITGIFPYRLWNGSKYVVFVQGTTLKNLDTATGTVTTPTVRGTAVASSAKGAGFFANNRLHYGNGTDQKWFDGTTWRDSGLGTLTTTQIQNIVIAEGVREFTTAQNSSVTLTAGSTGTFGTATYGFLFYVAIFDTSVNEIGPATNYASTGRVKTNNGQKVTVGALPDLSGVNANWVKLIGGTGDGTNLAWFFTNTSTAISSCSRASLTLTVTSATHGLSTGDVVILTGTTNFDGIYAATVSDANTFMVTLPYGSSGANTATGTVKRIVAAANATTSVDVIDPTQDTTYQVNQDRGLAASTIGGSQPGYQFYLSIYNPNGGGHVGNRVQFGNRFLQTGYRCNVRLSALPDLSGTDTEYTLLIGRTGDGADVPYACADNAVNWAYALSGQTTFYLVQPAIDGSHELPTRNTQIPSACNMFAATDSYCYAADTGSPYLRRSGSLADALAGIFTGRPEQSWAADDINTFPTGEALTGIFEVDNEILCGTLNDCAISTNLAGIEQWVGPWNIGIAGRRAGTKCGAHGFYWVSGDKQLCTFQDGLPTVISEEYQLAELSQIGDSHLSTVECAYYRNAAQEKDELRIEFQKQDGTPYTVIHDFKLRELFVAPGSIYGQGFASQYQGPLGTAFTLAQVRDGNGKLQVYAGATNGYLYELYSGANDAGTEYTADLITLINGGAERIDVPFIDWYGDSEVDIQIGQVLKTSLAAGAEFSFQDVTPTSNPAQSVQGAEDSFLYRAYFDTPEMQHAYFRFMLASHSADGNLSLNSPPHVPLESYGRIYEFIPAVGDARGR